MRVRVPLIALAALLTGFAPAPLPSPDRGKADLARMEGSWRVISHNTYPIPPESSVRVVVARGRLTFREHDTINSDYAVSLSTASRPCAIDLKGKGGKSISGVYLLRGDTLTICYSLGGARRPQDPGRPPAGMPADAGAGPDHARGRGQQPVRHIRQRVQCRA
jgi:uncharacterized protein (TIGR03067 family)